MVLWTTTAVMMTMMMMITTTMTTMTISSSPGCPAGCACKWKNGKQTVECVDKKVTSVTLALGIDPATQVLDISDNDLSAAGLPHDTFAAAGLSNLQRIHASRCNVYYVHDRAFRGLTNLVDLDLSGNCLRQVPTGAFAECPSLMKLSLSGNPIGRVPARAFRHLGQLTSLDLSGCGLTAVEAGAFDDLDGLVWLRLDDNLLTHVPGSSTLPARLHGIDLHRNDWQCDCRMVDMHRWLTENRGVPMAEEPVCSGPASYADVPVSQVPEVELACAPAAYPGAPPVQDVAEGVNVSFRCLVAATPVATVEWLYGDAPVYRHNASELITVDGNTTAELYVYNASVADAGAYACVAENRAGRARVNFTVTVRPLLAAGTVDDRSAPSQSSSATAGGGGAGDSRPLLYVGCAAAGSVALSAAVAVLVAVRCRRMKRSGGGGSGRTGGDSSSANKRRPAAPVADGYRTVSTTADKELCEPEAGSPASARATSATLVTVTTAAATTTAGPTRIEEVVECNPDVVSDVKRAGWEIDFEQIVWAECPPATGYVSIQIPVQCGIECLGAYYATAAEAVAAGNRYGTAVRKQRRRAAVLTAAYDDTCTVVRTTAQGGYPKTTTGPGTIGTPAAAVAALPPTIVVDDPDAGGGGGCGGVVVAPIISPPLPFRSADENEADKDDSIAL